MIPSLLLAWIAFRSVEQQQVVVENQAAALYQAETDLLAEEIQILLEQLQADFRRTTQQLTSDSEPQSLGAQLDQALERQLPGAIGFVVSPGDQLLSPSSGEGEKRQEVALFLEENEAFLANRATARVIVQKSIPAPAGAQQPGAPRQEKAPSPGASAAAESVADTRQARSRSVSSKLRFNNVQQLQTAEAPVPQQAVKELAESDAEPEQAGAQVEPKADLASTASDRREGGMPAPELAAFRKAIGAAPSGILTRLSDEGSNLFIWERPAGAPGYLVGCMLSSQAIAQLLKSALPRDEALVSDYVLAVLNERNQPVWTSRDTSLIDWADPFVATPIGEILPMWEATLYLLDPQWLERNARTAKLTISLMGSAAIGTILLAGFLVIAAARRRMELAERKSDFVSNVSHELKTPLTSIRMFGELLQQPELPEEKRLRFGGVITGECERLSRLVGNVLSFSRLERNRVDLRLEPVDLTHLLRGICDKHQARLEEAKLALTCHLPEAPVQVKADTDALEQVILNLLANAEKYAAEGESIELTLMVLDGNAEISVADRGPGVPRGKEKRIFQAFERAVDPMTAGQPGAGLGLAICAGLIERQQGRIGYRPRDGGGAVFWFSLPLLP